MDKTKIGLKIIVILIITAMLFSFVTACKKDEGEEDKGEQTTEKVYSYEEIKDNILEEADREKIKNELNTNGDKYKEIFRYIDQELMGQGYKIYNVYESDTAFYGTEDNLAYVVKVVLDEYMEAFQKSGKGADSKYILMFYSTTPKDSEEPVYRNTYSLFQFGRQWEQELKEEFHTYRVKNEELVVSYNIFLNLDGAMAPKEKVDNWEQAGENGGFLGANSRLGNTVSIVNSGGKQSKSKAEAYLKKLSPLLKKYYIKEVEMVYLKEGIAVETVVDVDKLENTYFKDGKEIVELYQYPIDSEGDIS